jgi:hypothetical protein
LWLLTWLQAAGSIVYVHAAAAGGWTAASGRQRWRLGARNSLRRFNLLACLLLSGIGWAPPLAPWAFVLALVETLQGVVWPAVGASARAIGLRQLASSALFLLLLASAYLV